MRLNISLVALVIIFTSNSILFSQQGELYELTEIEFQGNSEISSSVLKQIIYSEETPWWFYKFLNSFTSFGKEPVYFDSSNIQIDLQSLKEYYNAHGFFKAKFDYSYSVDTTSKDVVLTYIIEESNPAKFRNIKYLGLEKVPENIMARIYAESILDSSQVSEQLRIEQNIAHIVEIMVNRGFMLVKHDSTVILIDTTLNSVDLFIYYDTGNRFKISEINVTKKGDGAEDVTDYLLTELTDIVPEEYYNLDKIRKGQSRLIRTGLFNSLILEPQVRDTLNNYVPLRLEGSIGRMNEFLPGILMNDEFRSFNLGLNANYIRKNFFGDARKLTLATETAVTDIAGFNFADFFSQRNYTIDGYARVSLKLEQPYLFKKPIYGSLENYFQTQTFKRKNEKIYGVKAALEFELPDFTFINQLKTYYNLEFLDARATDIPGGDTLFISLLNIFYQTSYLGLQLGSAKANNLYFPTSGNNQLLSLETAITNVSINLSGSGIDYGTDSTVTEFPVTETKKEIALFYRAEYSSSFYLPMEYDNSSIFAIKTKIGYIQTFSGGRTLIPANKTFYAGGSNSVRGWRSRDLLPASKIEYINIADTNAITGGTFLLEGSFEMRKRFLENMGVTVFIDYGNVWNGYGEFRFDEVALASGFGLRYYSSIAPIRIDFGLKFYDPSNKKFLWENWNKAFFKNFEFHFGIGEAF